MDNGKIVVTIHMGMCIHIRRTTVRRPTRMTDTDVANGDISLDLVTKCRQTSNAFFDTNASVVVNSDSG